MQQTSLFNADTLSGIKISGELKLKYATRFSVSEFGQYRVVSIAGSGDYLIVPEGADVPDDLPDGMIVLKQPLDKTYLVSTSVMDFVCRLDSLDYIALSGTQANDWSIDEAKKAMSDKKILYAGKYRAPDYELILSKGCNLAIENTMIYHEPEVKEKLEELGIPVLVETSSYEEHPLGRLEWIKLYGILFGAEDKADDYFEEQLSKIEPVMESADADVTVAFFYVTTSGLINVRKPGDYISTMIDLAGGNYIIDDDLISADNSLSTMNMQMEDFYSNACNADIIIYNSTIAGEIGSVDELVSKDALFADFKAVKENEVYCTDRDLFQQTTGMAEFMNDLNSVFNGKENDLHYLKKLD
ncbi:MAG: ABC transporter substrate-binding protein [Lachnospiraceae bacterium]|nr:ABC transporter substrate-binding protein [Lachnospiraceae bacterium]